MTPNSKESRIYAILALIALTSAIGLFWLVGPPSPIGTDVAKQSEQAGSKILISEKGHAPADVAANLSEAENGREDSNEAIPLFEHEFIEIEEVIDEVSQSDVRGNQFRRRILAYSPQYPEPVFVEETLRKGPIGGWESIETRLEIASEWIFKFREVEESRIEQLVRDLNAQVVDYIPQLDLWTLRFRIEGIDERDALISEFASWSWIESVHPNELIWPIGAPNDPGYEDQWEFAWMDAERAWDLIDSASISDRKNVAVAIVDTGVNVNHADMSPWVNTDEIGGNGRDDDGNGQVDDINGFDFYTRTGDVQRSSGHGVGVSFTAGRISNNNLQKASVGGHVDIMACVCFSTSGAGSTSAANNSIIYAVDNGARVINCSFIGGSAYTYMYALNYAESHGVIVVAGSGNNGKNIDVSAVYPVASTQTNVVGVGATGEDDSYQSYSNYGAESVEIFAPAPSRGTSYATPVVSSAVSLLIADDPNAHFSVIIDRLLKGADKKEDLFGKAATEGRLNLFKSLRLNTLRRPDDLEVFTLGESAFRLFWNDRSTGETGFIVERSETDPATVQDPDDPSQMTWSVVSNDVPANTTYYDDLTAPADKTCYYRVSAKGATHHSARNFETRVAVSAEESPSAVSLEEPISNLFTQGSSTAIRLAWYDTSRNELGFILERSDDLADGFYELARLDAGETAYEDDDVVAGRNYFYRLKTFNAAFGAYTETVEETASTETNPVVLNAPTNLNAMPSSFSSIDLVWEDASSGENGYYIWRAPSLEGEYVLIADLPADATSYVDSELLGASTYVYRVEAYSAFGTASASGQQVTTPGEPAVLAEAQLSGSALDSETVELMWTDSASERQSGYVLERTNGGGDFQIVESFDAHARTAVDVGLSPESNYRYRVGTTDGDTVIYSNVLVLDTPPPPPVLVAPDLSIEVLGMTSGRIYWDDLSARESAYLVERASAIDGPYVEIALLTNDSEEFVDVGLKAGRTTYYRVRVQGYVKGVLSEVPSGAVALTTWTTEEQWRIDHFGTLVPDGSSARSSDPDGDGWTNLAEFATLHSPLTAQPYLALPGMTEDRRVTLKFDRRFNSTVRYVVEVTNDLNSRWQTLAELPAGANGWNIFESGVTVDEAPLSADGAAVLVTDGFTHAGEMRFLRLVIESAK